MIPLYLEVHQFMAYRTLELDFTQFSIACLSGQNGSGKSTILDALTWALFEKSRSAHSEDVIRIGESETRVTLRFQLEGERYQILRARKRSRGKSSGKTTLEFQIQAQDQWRALTQKTVRETQQLIEDTLHMDYNLFIHSSFILQGRADVFTTSSPTERKKVLADILNLETYDALSQKAQETRKQLQDQKQHLLGQSEQLGRQLEQKSSLEVARGETEVAWRTASSEREQAETAWEALQQRASALSQEIAKLDQIAQDLAQEQRENTQLQAQYTQLQTEQTQTQSLLAQQDRLAADYQAWVQAEQTQLSLTAPMERYQQLQLSQQELTQTLLKARHEIELRLERCRQNLSHLQRQSDELQRTLNDQDKITQGYQQWQNLHAQLNHWAERQAKHQQWIQEEQQLNSLIQQAQHQAELERQQLATRIHEKQQQLTPAEPLQAELTQIERQLYQLEHTQERLERIREEGLTLRHKIEHLQQQQQAYEPQLLHIRERIAHFRAQQDSACPLCERILSAADAEVLIRKYTQDYENLELQRQDEQEQISRLEQKSAPLREKYQQLARELKQRDALQKRQGECEQLMARNESHQKALVSLESDYQALSARIENGHIRPTERVRLQHLLTEISANAYQPEEHQLIQTQYRDWQWAEHRWRELQQAQQQWQSIAKEQTEHRQEQQYLEHQLAGHFAPETTQALQAVEAEIKSLGDISERYHQARTEQEQRLPARAAWEALQQAQAKAQSQTKQLEALQQELGRKHNRIQTWEMQLLALPGHQEAAELLTQERQQQQARLHHWQQLEREQQAQYHSLEQQWQQLENQMAALASVRAEMANLDQEIFLYKELGELFGKNGLQAVVIENAIPEIEYTANQMLTQMTDGRMHLRFQTQKAQKTQDKLKETLDILISDELGSRSYETFSAGEAFRVNFAIRLAISRLLARRAGAKLQTLVIDEGFGTQDELGKTRLVEAINAVAEQFATILVITHVDDLKALFPCRIEVSRLPSGSEIALVA
jgi:exonuclease SbcC